MISESATYELGIKLDNEISKNSENYNKLKKVKDKVNKLFLDKKINYATYEYYYNAIMIRLSDLEMEERVRDQIRKGLR